MATTGAHNVIPVKSWDVSNASGMFTLGLDHKERFKRPLPKNRYSAFNERVVRSRGLALLTMVF